MDGEFQFAVGQTVFHRSSMDPFLRAKRQPIALFVLAQLTEQCASIHKRYYRCRMLGNWWNVEDFAEDELIATNACKLAVADVVRLLDATKDWALGEQDFETAATVLSLINRLTLHGIDRKRVAPESTDCNRWNIAGLTKAKPEEVKP